MVYPPDDKVSERRNSLSPPAQSTVASKCNVSASAPHSTTSRALKEEKAAIAQLSGEVLLASGE